MVAHFGSFGIEPEKIITYTKCCRSKEIYGKCPKIAITTIEDILTSTVQHPINPELRDHNVKGISSCKYAVELRDGIFILRGVCVETQCDRARSIVVSEDARRRVCSSLWRNGCYGSSDLTGGDLLSASTERHTSKKLPNSISNDQDLSTGISLDEVYELSLEECMFLMASLGVADIFKAPLNSCDEPVLPQYIWSEYILCSERMDKIDYNNFEKVCTNIARYISYHYYRSMGWIVRPSSKMGVDWALYANGPVREHSKYVVTVLPDFSRISSKPYNIFRRRIPATTVIRMVRITNSVRKELLMCHVVAKPELAFEELASISCLRNFSIWDISVSRFCPQRSRE